MNAPLSLPPLNDLDTTMLNVARDVAQDIYLIEDILKNNNVSRQDFEKWKDHPRFIQYVTTEKEAWLAASNVGERTKLKAGIVVEQYMADAFTELRSVKNPLNHRVELMKVLAKIAGMGEPASHSGGNGGPAFNLQINIGSNNAVSIRATPTRKTIDHDDDGYDPFTSPNTLED